MKRNKIILIIVILSVIALIFSGCGGSVTPDNQPIEIIVEQTFESQSGIEFDTGVGLEVSVPPSLTENQMKLVVKYNSNPTQPQNDSSDFINLHSSYSISITPQEESLGQKLFQERENRDQELSNATLIFKIPQGMDSHNAVILEWTDEGWILAENEVGLPGGEVDGEDISIVPGHLSKFAIGEWLYNTVFSALKKIPEPPPPPPIISISETVVDDQNNLLMEINLDSPYGITLNLPKIGSLGLAGMWYCIEVESDNDINVDINGGIYLPPGIKRDITITFPPTGGDASICLQTGFCPLPRAAWNWVSRLGLPTEELEGISNMITSTELLLENYELYPNGVWNLEGVVWLVKKLLLQSFWKLTGSKIKFLANIVPVSIDITTFITASWFDGRPDLCVEVSPQSENIILSSITVSPSTMNIIEGDSQTISSITAHYSDDGTADIALDDCTYDSSNTGVATVDAGVITAITSGVATITVKYTEGDITKNDTVEVTVTSTTKTYIITASAGSHGSISPSGSVTVNQGSDKLFTITPNTGYSIADVLVDGSSVGAVTSYTFTNVTEDHTISATFISVAPGLVHNLTKGTYYNTIQAALDDADNNNTIEVADGTYDETITFPFIKKIILRSVNGASSTIIRGNNNSATVITDAAREGTILDGFTITHASGNKGRGIYTNGNLNIKNCIISGNSIFSSFYGGGGIYNYKGSISITGSTISGNTSSYYGGGGIYNYKGSISITGSTISGNTSSGSAGIYNEGGSISITGSTISGNTASGGISSTGGIKNDSGNLTITGSTISGNTTSYGGGGIYNYSGNLTITGSIISGNSSRYGGGGIYFGYWTSGTLLIGGSSDTEKNTICGNYRIGEVLSLDQQIMDYSGSLYETYKDTNYISVYCD